MDSVKSFGVLGTFLLIPVFSNISFAQSAGQTVGEPAAAAAAVSQDDGSMAMMSSSCDDNSVDDPASGASPISQVCRKDGEACGSDQLSQCHTTPPISTGSGTKRRCSCMNHDSNPLFQDWQVILLGGLLSLAPLFFRSKSGK